GEEQQGKVYSFDTVKWVPIITQDPAAQSVVDVPSDLTLTCLVETVADDFADLTGFVVKRIVGDKDGTESGDDETIYTGTPTNLGDNGKRSWDCSVTLSIEEIGNEGSYYFVVTNSSGDDVSANALVLTKRLVVYYAFESIVNDMVIDSSPSGLDGKLTSTLAGGVPVTGGVVEGMIGNAIKLVGADVGMVEDPNAAFVDVGVKPFDLGVDGANARTLSAWAKATRMNNAGVWDFGAYSTGQNCSVRTLSLASTGAQDGSRWRIQHWGGGDRDFTIVPSFDTWMHFVYVYTGSTCQLYVNGEKILDFATALNTSNANNVRVGAWQSNVWNGLIDEFRLYNYALTPLEIGQLYIEGTGGEVCVANPARDLNGDCVVNLLDFAVFAAGWAESTIVTP
ncbi:MAG: LamG domain-containing protein, partial [Sedimentisphaerales bacterium]|nr:LamG domain-containing protein [Sedimentisphaerales bacterium]